MAYLVWDPDNTPHDFNIIGGIGDWNTTTANWSADFGGSRTTFTQGDTVWFTAAASGIRLTEAITVDRIIVDISADFSGGSLEILSGIISKG